MITISLYLYMNSHLGAKFAYLLDDIRNIVTHAAHSPNDQS